MWYFTLLLVAAVNAQPIVSGEWVQQHLADPQVRIIYVGNVDDYRKGHIPGARTIDHMATVQMGENGHRLAPNDVLARVLAAAGAADGMHVVLYGDSPMATAWVNSAFVAIGHGDDISWLDGGMPTWRAEHRPIETDVPQALSGTLTVRPAGDMFVDAGWLRARLNSPMTKILDVRTTAEWNRGHLPGATLILWQDLFADVKMQKFKSPEEIRGVFAKAGLQPGQEVVTYCAIGMRASLVGWAARTVARVPAKIYIGSWEDWSHNSANPIVKP